MPRTLSLWHSMIIAVAGAVLATAVTPAAAAPSPKPTAKKVVSPVPKKVVVRGSGGGWALLDWSIFASLRP